MKITFASQLVLAGLTAIAPPAFGATVAFQNDIAAQNPLLWYQLNETNGPAVLNHGSLGSGFNGTAFNGPTFGAPGDGGDTGVNFINGSGQQRYIQSGNTAPAGLLGNPTFTAEALVFL